MGPEFLPLLKAPVDFHFRGAIGKNPKTTKLEGGMTIDKIKFNYDGGKLAIAADKLLLNEMFKTALPLEDLDLKLNAEGTNALEIMSSLNIEYAIKVCGNEFKPEADKGPTLARADRQFHFSMMPKPVENFGQVIFAKDATFDQLFLYQLQGKKQIAPAFANHQEMVSDLCYQKTIASLQPPELEKIQPLFAAADTVASGEGLQALLLKSVPITVSRQQSKEMVAEATPAPAALPATVASPATATAQTPAASVTPSPAASPVTSPSPVASPTVSAAATPPATAEQAKAAMTEARNFLRAGKYAEAKAALEAVPITNTTLPATEQGAFHNLKAWIYLYSSDAAQAAQSFEQAFNARKEISDAEGLLRANEDLKKDAEAAKWLEYIKKTLKEHPELKSHLTPNMQKRFVVPNEAAAESHP
jgi:hypothetical protein